MVTATKVRTPDSVSTRPAAHQLLSDAPDDLRDHAVKVSFGGLVGVAPSFVDELVRLVLVDRSAASFELLDVTSSTARYARRSAKAHDVSARLSVQSTEAALA